MSGDVFEHVTAGRNPRSVLIIVVVWFVLILLRVQLQATWLLLVPLFLATLPALFDVINNRSTGLRIDDARIAWQSGTRDQSVPLDRIAEVELALRLDASLRATLMLDDGTKLRLPYECLPRRKVLEPELIARGLTVRRNDFSFF